MPLPCREGLAALAPAPRPRSLHPKAAASWSDRWSGCVPAFGKSQYFGKVKVLSIILGNRSRKGKGGGTRRVLLRLGVWPSSLTHCNIPCQRAGSLLDTAFKKCFTWKHNGKFSSPVEGCFSNLFFFSPFHYFYMKPF